ncbi:MAG: hypothetical protein BGO98_34045 [Myxococcales bacterium 68-20]|nr:hypothetical protein [Myxococcales bacterium]OJY25649.1 MAG: hypothetical protein BGO98_34045 [Myxococcales bacterium 68-20]
MNETQFDRRRGARASVAYAISVVSAVAALCAVSCTTEGKPLLIGDDLPNPPSFTSVPEAGVDAEAGLIAYCPSSQCPPGWTTCPDSRFPCDTNILADPLNCGACGAACPNVAKYENFSCVAGACVAECAAGRLDCDGLPDNGCEVTANVPDRLNCGACGNACPADSPCAYQDGAKLLSGLPSDVGCGCPTGLFNCGGLCLETSENDQHCGACGNRCDETGGAGAPQYTNMAYGCVNSTCGNLKCKKDFLNCDGDIENGCETPVLSDDNCGGCGNACPSGQHCYQNYDKSRAPECLCAGDLTLCDVPGDPKAKYCTDLNSDEANCGACGAYCWAAGYPPGSRFVCDFGACVRRCLDGYADCNGNEADGCEVDTTSDPRNCGGCGIVCDGVAGQACVAGKCVVAPCDEADAGELTR